MSLSSLTRDLYNCTSDFAIMSGTSSLTWPCLQNPCGWPYITNCYFGRVVTLMLSARFSGFSFLQRVQKWFTDLLRWQNMIKCQQKSPGMGITIWLLFFSTQYVWLHSKTKQTSLYTWWKSGWKDPGQWWYEWLVSHSMWTNISTDWVH